MRILNLVGSDTNLDAMLELSADGGRIMWSNNSDDNWRPVHDVHHLSQIFLAADDGGQVLLEVEGTPPKSPWSQFITSTNGTAIAEVGFVGGRVEAVSKTEPGDSTTFVINWEPPGTSAPTGTVPTRTGHILTHDEAVDIAWQWMHTLTLPEGFHLEKAVPGDHRAN
jgi:hypothetical protein